MPFADHEFDYSVCSHVLQMSDSVDEVTQELQRISKKGYIEFPHPLYDFLFDFDAHRHFVVRANDEVLWLPKEDVDFGRFAPATAKMRAIFEKGHCDFVSELRDQLFFGFEWDQTLQSRRVARFEDLFAGAPDVDVQPFNSRRRMSGLLRSEARNALRWMGI